MKQEFVKAGTTIISQGMEGEHAYIIQSGKVDVYLRDDDGEEIFLAELGPGSIIGEMAPLLGGRRRANVIAQEDLKLLSIEAKDLLRIIRSSDSLHEYLSHLMSRRLGQIETQLEKKIVAQIRSLN